LGIAFLSAQLQVKGWTTRLVDLNLVADWHSLLPAWLRADNPRVVGISGTAFSVGIIQEIAAICKAWDAKTLVIAGGYCCLAPNICDIADLDAICIGEGDWVLGNVLAHIANGTHPFAGVGSIHYRGEDGHWEENLRQPLLTPTELNQLPFPDFNSIEPSRYGEVPAIPLYVQRGCYNACRFCDVAQFYANQKIRAMSPTTVAEWMLRAKALFGATHVQFMDDDFLSKPAWFANLADAVANGSDQYPIQANFQTRPGDILRAQAELAAHAGFLYQVELGIESFSQTQLDRWKKHQRPTEGCDAISFLASLRVPTLAYLIFSDREATTEELDENIAGLKACPPLCSFPDHLAVPAVVVCHDINTTYTLTGEREIAGVPFLETFDDILQETEESAGSAYYFYIALQAATEQSPANSITREIGTPLLGLVEHLFANRLDQALAASVKVSDEGATEQKNIIEIAIQGIQDNFEDLSREIARLPRELRD
jgi:hypothetical protein